MAKRGEKRNLRGRAGRMQGGRGSGRASQGQVRLWGRHAVEAALNNPERDHRKLWATREGLARLPISDAMESLNVSNAAAVALYAVATRS